LNSKLINKSDTYFFKISCGTYILFFSIKEECAVTPGKLGKFVIPPGNYCYIGSALLNLQKRILRHLRKNKNRYHWHIDYLLNQKEVSIDKVWILLSRIHLECCLNNEVLQKLCGYSIITGFGSSDCKSRCLSHLTYLEISTNDVIRHLNHYINGHLTEY